MTSAVDRLVAKLVLGAEHIVLLIPAAPDLTAQLLRQRVYANMCAVFPLKRVPIQTAHLAAFVAIGIKIAPRFEVTELRRFADASKLSFR